ncbi:DNA topoisomerase 2-alpha-like [Paramacrobiotus metropolitanus]|uniref:DNA topoisomerase 2-alpha-like n=1 Tax=Paramacrobiotus metropolitanus TaxID=2943436 RepID=UPI002445B50E|nr:DNA topoisomerase 2-alpha-like [Paramacrobiotus metropolitanus]
MSSEEDEYVPGGSGSPKKTKATKKKKAAASSEDEGDTDNQPTKKARTPKEKKAIEKIYQKKSQLEHILIRPDTYIGSTELVSQEMWVYDTEEKKMVFREIKFVPGLYKIFDEILVNAADNKQRDPKMSMIKIAIDAEKNQISVWNNGHGIPVVEHKEEKMLVPTMIFGHLLTSSNYDDDEKKVTGGRNGYGAKLCNIFSNKFVVETASKEYKKKFKQEWSKNMGKAGEPKVDSFSGEDYTKVTFEPDLSKFKMAVLDKDTVDLLSRRAYDVAGTSGGVKVYLNGEKLPISNFKQYVELYTANNTDEMGNPLKVVTEKANERWEVAVTSSDTGFNQVSFVNSIATTKGGRHVEYITDQITKAMNEVIKKKNKSGAEIKPFQIKNHLWVFVNCLIENPTFDSQTKENMTLQVRSFGSKCQLSDKFIGNALKSGIIENILAFAKAKAESQMGKKIHGAKTAKLRGIPKLEDANDAGTKYSSDCTLILTEGDSAKALAVSGFSVVGRDKYGVFPLRGKLLNVREATPKQLMDNAEINSIVKILGLQYKRKYDSEQDLKSLRYGKLMIMTDQDQDGSHIKGLLINFIHFNWPSLLRHVFLEEFITPIVKATKGNVEECFYSLPELEEWKANRTESELKRYKIKYYKGLGTSTSKEAKEYFSNMTRHRIGFRYGGKDDDDAIDLAFAKNKADARKDWLTKGMEERKQRRLEGRGEVYLYTKTTKSVTFKKFVDEELILFSNMDNERSIPSLVDGLKPGQRKVLFTCFTRKKKGEAKVAQLVGSVAEKSAYHHGEQSLMSTIVGLAQNFVGSNNINLLLPLGQFGTRLLGGKDAASARYIFTNLSPMARAVFHPHDDPLLNYLNEDNQKIEPEWYIPVVPMVLINGAEGIGTGWMTKIPNYNPLDIVANLRALIRGDEIKPMKPWYKGYRGEILPVDPTRYLTNGEVAVLDQENSIEITELPIRTWTQNYKEAVVEPLLLGSESKDGKGKPPQIQDYKEYHTDTTVRFVIRMSGQKFEEFQREGFHKTFKLQQTISMSSMVLFDSNGVIRKYDNVSDILREFFEVRMTFYGKRKDFLVARLSAEALNLENQARFIDEKIKGKITIENVKKKDLINKLKKAQPPYDSDPVKTWKKKFGVPEDETPTADDDDGKKKTDEPEEAGSDFDYILKMPLWSLTNERFMDLMEKRDNKNEELSALRKKTPSDLYTDDLDEFESRLKKVEAEEADAEAFVSPTKKPAGRAKGQKGRGAVASKADTLPSVYGTRVEPVVDTATIAKFEKAKELKDRKAAGITVPRARAKKPAENGENPTSSEAPSSDKPTGEENGGVKQPSKAVVNGKDKKKPEKKAKKIGSDDESSFDSADLTDDDDEIMLNDSEDEYVEKVPKKKRVFTSDDAGETSTESPLKIAKVDEDRLSIEIDEPEISSKSVSNPLKVADKMEPAENGAKKDVVPKDPKTFSLEKTKEPGKLAAEKKPSALTKIVHLLSSDDEDDYPSGKKAPAKKLVKKKEPAKILLKKAVPDKVVKAGPSEKPGTSTSHAKRESSEEIIPVAATRAPVDKMRVFDLDDEDEIVPARNRTNRAGASNKKYAFSDDSDEDYFGGVN